MKIIIDIDGVLAETQQYALLQNSIEEVWDSEFASQVLTPTESLDIPVVLQAPWAIAQLRLLGCEIIYATGRPKELERITHEWLCKHFGFVHRLWLIRTKADLLGDLLIDDSPEQIQAWARTDRPYIVFDRPWNKHIPGPRATDWSSVVKQIGTRLLITPKVSRPRSAYPW